jgi:hypothetical protein
MRSEHVSRRVAWTPSPVVRLPKGVTKAAWAREMGRWQNPRIRAFLGTHRILGDVLESNFAILHCSPKRLLEMLVTVRRVAELLRTDITLLLDGPSLIPDLESSRLAVRANLNHIDQTLLKQLDSFPEHTPASRHDELRRFLCVAIGQLHRFLQDSFGGLVSADPRATHDADYYLSKEFPRDIEEAEWLFDSVTRLEHHLRELDRDRPRLVVDVRRALQKEHRVPSREAWAETDCYLERLVTELTPRLREVISLRGIRIEELELLDHYSTEIPTICRILAELHESSCDALGDSTADHVSASTEARDPLLLHRKLCDRMVPQLRSLDDYLRDLGIFVPLWRRDITQRRALLLRLAAMRAGSKVEPDGSGSSDSDLVS